MSAWFYWHLKIPSLNYAGAHLRLVFGIFVVALGIYLVFDAL